MMLMIYLLYILINNKWHAISNGYSVTGIDPYYVWLPAVSLRNNRSRFRSQASNWRKKFHCTNNCGSCFTHRGSLTRHLRYECQQNPRFKCPTCDFRSRWTSDVYKHVRRKHQGTTVRCIDIGRNWKNEPFFSTRKLYILCGYTRRLHLIRIYCYSNKNFANRCNTSSCFITLYYSKKFWISYTLSITCTVIFLQWYIFRLILLTSSSLSI